MSPFMPTMPSAGLERQAAGVERDALADERDGGPRLVRRRSSGAGSGAAAPSRGSRRAGRRASALRIAFSSHTVTSNPAALARGHRPLGQLGRGERAAGLVDEVARPAHRLGDDERPVDGGLRPACPPRPTSTTRSSSAGFGLGLERRVLVAAEHEALDDRLRRRPGRTPVAGGAPSRSTASDACRLAARASAPAARRSTSASTSSAGPSPTTKRGAARRRRARARTSPFLPSKPCAGEEAPVDAVAVEVCPSTTPTAEAATSSGAVRASSMVRGTGSSGSGVRPRGERSGSPSTQRARVHSSDERRLRYGMTWEPSAATGGGGPLGAAHDGAGHVEQRRARGPGPGTTNSVGSSKRPPTSSMTCLDAPRPSRRSRASRPPRASPRLASSVASSAMSTQRSRSTAVRMASSSEPPADLGAGQADGGLGLVDARRRPRSGARTWARGRRRAGRWCRRRPCRSRACVTAGDPTDAPHQVSMYGRFLPVRGRRRRRGGEGRA